MFYYSDKIKIWFTGLLIFFILIFPLYSQDTKKVEFNASSMEVDKNIGFGAKRLLDNVVFRHENATMYCDSAYYYSELNSLDAYHNVYINQADTIHLYGDILYYDGNTRLAKVRGNVKLIKKDIVLKTTALDFDLNNNVGYYRNYAVIKNIADTLTSKTGYYYTRQNMLHFKDSVVIRNPRYTIFSDTIKYNSESNNAYFYGPTDIISDSNVIYCERGWYNTVTNIAQLNENASIDNKKQILKGDSLYYERETGYGRAIGNVEVYDKEMNVILNGNKGLYYENTDFALLTDSARFIQINDQDSIYLHADTLKSESDSSGYKIVKAYFNVKVFKPDLQGVCDSLTYTANDSIIRLFYDPVLWSDESQLSADYIEIHTKNRKIYKMYLIKSSFIISKQDSSKFNQIKGKDMVCHFYDNKLCRIDVSGNGQTVYYPVDDEEIIGVNMAESSNLEIFFKDNKVDKIHFLKDPDAKLYPLNLAPENKLLLNNFKWLEKYRPKSKEEIFN